MSTQPSVAIAHEIQQNPVHVSMGGTPGHSPPLGSPQQCDLEHVFRFASIASQQACRAKQPRRFPRHELLEGRFWSERLGSVIVIQHDG
jgi:hypothetical protein